MLKNQNDLEKYLSKELNFDYLQKKLVNNRRPITELIDKFFDEISIERI